MRETAVKPQIEDLYELSPMQQGMLFHTLYESGSGVYCEQLTCALTGELDRAAFEQAWERVVERHPALRTAFHWRELDKPLQVVYRDAPVPWHREDWRSLTAAEQERRLKDWLTADRRHGFELSAPPLLRLALFRTGARSHRFVFTFHHILMDGWCLPLVLAEAFASYAAARGGAVAHHDRTRPYRDFIVWLQTRDPAGDEAFWRTALAGFRAPTPLPYATASTAGATGPAAYTERLNPLSEAETTALQRLARDHQVTINTLVQAAWAVLLARATGEQEVVFGATVSGRPAALPGVETMIGVFINTLPVRVAVPPEAGLLAWLCELQDRQAEAREHEHTPLARIQAWSEVPPGRPLFESILVFENQPFDALHRTPAVDGFGVTDVRVAERTNYPLTLVVVPGAALRLRAIHDLRRLEASGAARALGHLRTLLAGMAEDPSRRVADLPLLTPAERHQLLVEWAAVEPVGGGDCLHRLFERRARQTPGAVAAVCGGETLTYAELDRRADRLAHRLAARGIGPDVRVGLCLERSLDLVTAVLAVLKAGGSYVPIDPLYPAERIAYLVADSRAAVLVTDERLLDRLPPAARTAALFLHARPEEEPAGALPRAEVAPDHLAYVIYTSGSTGRPKGVQVTHRNVVRLFAATERWFGFGAEDVWTLFHSYAFDFSVWEIWGALLYGGRLVVVPHWTSRSPEAFHALLCREGVTVLNQTPSAFRQLLRADAAAGGGTALRQVIFGGEALDLPSLQPWFESHGDERPRLVNMYGITETTVHVTFRPLAREDATGGSVVGRALPDLRLRVLDARLEPVPVGVAGEVHVGGAGLARGYLGRPELTAERFVPDPFAGPDEPGARLYRSGDLARLRPDRDLEYLGRIDQQVKIRGFRIELGEIEATLAAHPAVAAAVVVARDEEGGAGDRRLAAYVVPRQGRTADPGELRACLRATLPDHMVPAFFVALDALPLTPHGKVDRQALPAPGAARPAPEADRVAPRDPLEAALATVWATALGLASIGIDDNFFALGGDSIRSVRVLALAHERGIDLTIEKLFQHLTVRELAAALGGPAAAVPEGRSAPAPFALVHAEDRRHLPAEVEDAYPLGHLQAGMLFHHELAPETGVYHNVTRFRLRAPFDADALRAALRELAAGHPVLRTSFALHAFSEPLQLVHRAALIPLAVEDLRGLPAGEREATTAARLDEERAQSFDAARPPLLRLRVLRHGGEWGAEELDLFLTEHHAILDGWSVAALLTELFQRYLFLLGLTDAPPPPPPAGGFRDFVALERAALAREETRRWWRETLAEAEPCTLPRWPGDGERGKRRTAVPLDPGLGAGLEAAARRAGVPLKSVLLAVHLRVLSLLTGRTDVITGLVTNGRPEEGDGDRVLGLFLNTVPLRLRLREGSWLDLAREAFAAESALLPHRRLPLAELQREHGGPLFEAAFNFVHFHVYERLSALTGIGLLGIAGAQTNNFPFTADFGRALATARVDLALEHGGEHAHPAQAAAWAGYYARTLAALAAAPEAPWSSTPLLSAAERHQILAEWNDTAAELSGAPIPAWIEEQAERSPDAVAVVCAAASLTYAELDRAANRLARRLQALGVGPESFVGVVMERSCELVVALLGTLKAGGAYLPLDPGLPRERLAAMLADSGTRLLLAQERFLPDLPRVEVQGLCLDVPGAGLAAESAERPYVAIGGTNAASMIYTSGSTGKPKGVVNTHRGLLNRLLWMQSAYGLTPADRVLQKTPFSFDVSVWEFFWPLMIGARLVMARPGGHRDPAYLSGLIVQEGVTTAHFVPSMLRIFLEEPGVDRCRSLRLVFASGEALPFELQERFYQLFARAGVELHNLYGPTEAAIDVTSWPCPRRSESPRVPIGRPIANTAIRILDPWLQPAAVGVPGELFIGGVQLARGYFGRPELTADRFIPDPMGETAGERLYRTGDLARCLPGGTVEYLGRIDFQVKIRGHRVELGEVEAALAAHPGVLQAAAALTPGGELAAWLVPQGGAIPAAELRRFLRERLPEPMVPARVIHLAQMPLNAHGKLDRRALPLPTDKEGSRSGAVPPRTPTEEVVAGIWADVLGREAVSSLDDFFELGGHSLLATRAISWVRQAFRLELPLRTLFEAPTVAAFAQVIDAARREGSARPAPPIEPAACRVGETLLLSFAQQRLWLLDQLVPGNPFYNVPADLRVNGRLDDHALAAALAEVVRRHDVLRTTFPAVDGRPAQHIAPRLELTLPRLDLRALPAERAAAEAQRLVVEEARRPFDLARGPLLRAALVRITGEDHLLLATLHHIISDGWSSGVLRRELAALYEAFSAGRPSPLPELPIQYADFAVWQHHWLQGEVLAAQLAGWKERLADPPALDLPTDRPRPAVATFRGGDRWLRLPAGLAGSLAALGRRRGATLFMTLLAVWETLLHRYTGQTDLLVGTPIANRNRAEIEGLIGFFVNTLALRADLSGGPAFLELVERLREMTLGAYALQDLPFEKLVEELHPERDTSRNPLFQVAFILQNFPTPAVHLPGLTLTPVEVPHGTAKFDLSLFLVEDTAGLLASFEYAADLFDPPTLDRMLSHFQALAAAAAADPERPISALPLLSEAERHQSLREWADAPDLPAAQATLDELFAAQVARTPEATAITCEGGSLTYGELDRRAGRLARRLAALGVGPEVLVALCLERSPALVVAILGTLRAGGAYVPLDPNYPRERLAWILADSRAAVLVSEMALAGRLPEPLPPVVFLDQEEPKEEGEKPSAASGPGNLAYVIYTSGSTGRPKGVQVTHANVARLFSRTAPWFRFGSGDVWTLFHSYAFDFSVWELWGALSYGGRLVIVPWEVSRSPAAFHGLLRREGVTVLNQTPSAFRQLARTDAESEEPLPGLRLVIFGGEALDVRALGPWIERHGDRRPLLVNMYGITETTVHVTRRPVTATDVPRTYLGSPIGIPIPDLRARVLEASLEPAPAGVPGEIHVSGDGLARGYLGRPELTAERFVPDPFAAEPGVRLYRTGDLARLRPDGELEHLGRIDQQVKIRGFRIELGEIEATLAAHPAVRDAAALLLHGSADEEAGGPRLVAYVVPGPAAAPDPSPAGDGRAGQIESWRAVFDDTYGESPVEAEPTFDIQGWNSSYTGLPIPTEEMREWVDGSVQRILAERPARVLEIGCGTGLLLFRLAPHVAVYRGTDFSATALAKLRQRLSGRGLDHVEIEQRAAADFAGIAPGSFDAVILNSVAQYFPGVDYLVAVIEGALRAVAPGGFLFAGDLRSRPLLSAFHAAVELHQAGGTVSRAQLRQRVRRSLAREEELALDPALFTALAGCLGAGQVDVQLRRGRQGNEMSRFRYDAVLRRRPDGEPAAGAERVGWEEAGLSLGRLRERLERTAPEEVEVTGVPNARVAAEVAALALLDGDEGPATAGELRRAAAERTAATVDPEDLWDLGRDLSYEVAIGWSEAGPDRMDVRMTQRRADGTTPRRSFPVAPADAAPGLPWSAWANDPGAGRFVRSLVPRLRDFLQGRLPEHMMPSAFVLLDALPLTPNGKLNRRTLPAPDLSRSDGRREHAAPRGMVEVALATIWSEVLGVERVGAYDDFFELGGHSLLATQVVARVRNAFAIELPLRALFEAPTLSGLAGRIETARHAGERSTVPPPVPRPAGDGTPPLSFSQQQLWLLDEREAGRADYNIAAAVRLSGELDATALFAALREIVRRHEALRTTFAVVDGRPVQVVGPPPQGEPPVIDLGSLPAAGQREESRRLAFAAARRPFDLAHGPLLRLALVRLEPGEHLVLLALHHIVADGWSVGVLVRELTALYGAFARHAPSPLPELPIQYADYALWQRRWLAGEPLEAQLTYWRRQLASLPVLRLPTDRPRPPVRRGRGRQLPFAAAEPPVRAVRELAEAAGATPFMLLLAVFAALLARASGQEDVVVGTDVANRNRREVEDLIGFFVNQLVLRLDVAGDPTFRELLGRARETALAAYAHQDVPFERLVAAVQPDRDLSRTPLFQVKLVLQNAPGGDLALPGLRIAPLPVDNPTAKFDLLVDLEEREDGLFGEAQYDVDLFDATTIDRLMRRFQGLLRRAVARPDAHLSVLLDDLDAEERREAGERAHGIKGNRLSRLRQIERRTAARYAEGD